MKKLFTKENILLLLAILVPLVCFIGLAFDLVGTRLNSYRYIENGFMLLDFKSFFITSTYGWAIILLGILNWLLLIACILIIVLAIVGKVRLKNKMNAIEIAAIAVGMVFSLLYLIEGAVYQSINNSTLKGNFYTIAFIPFILCSILFSAYMIVRFKMPPDFELTADSVAEKNVEHNAEKNVEVDIID